MAHWWDGRRTRHGARRWLRAAGMVVVAATLALGLSLASMFAVAGNPNSPSAYACGLVTAWTMFANDAPALAYPLPVGVNVPASHPIGEFAQQYAVGQTVSFGEDFSRMPNPPAAGSYSLRWTFGDGSPAVVALAPTHAFARPGTYNVYTQYKDTSNLDWNDFDSAQIQVVPSLLPNPPVARVIADKTAIVLGDSITFDATGSRAVVGSHLTYQWNFNDLGTATGPHVTHQFQLSTGSTFVTLIATDDRGARSVATINIGIVTDKSQVPAASLTANVASTAAGQPVLFDASSSTPASQPAGDQIAQYAWDFGDGTAVQTTQTATTSHVYRQPGHYRVAVQAVDTQGVPAQAIMAIAITPAASSLGIGAGGSGWLMLGGLALAVIVVAAGGWFLVSSQRKQARRERERLAMMELQRARRIPRAGVRPGDARWGDPRAGSRVGPPPASGGPGQPASRNDPRRGPLSRGGR